LDGVRIIKLEASVEYLIADFLEERAMVQVMKI
jgi:hypothetical protein